VTLLRTAAGCQVFEEGGTLVPPERPSLRLAIVGPGLIGTSVALAARRVWPDLALTEIDRGQSLNLASEADIVVLATPVEVTVDLLRHHSHHFSAATVLDTGSTKRAIVAAARDAGLTNFVGGHPMAGAASSGPTAARADLFDGKSWFLVSHGATAPAVTRVQNFVRALGATPMLLDDDGSEHDRVMAAVSHLPQVVASALMVVAGQAAGERGLSWAGAGLRDTTRLADSSATMWEGILASNADELRPLLTRLADHLQRIAGQLEQPQDVRKLFESARRLRSRIA
jgi:prephenate dehydrogenase